MDTYDSTNYQLMYEKVCRIKEISQTSDGFAAYRSAYCAIYPAVCFDIDGTLTYKDKETKNSLAESLVPLVARHVPLCFITGRGKTSTLRFLWELKSYVLASNKTLTENHFRRWSCITNNGYMLFTSDNIRNPGFLSDSIPLVDSQVKTAYLKSKKILQEKCAKILSKALDFSASEIISWSNNSIGENSLRFPFRSDSPFEISKEVIKELEQVVSQYGLPDFGVSQGLYKGKQPVVEVSMTTKGHAIDFVEKYLGIPKNKMLRIGDQGDYSGNDYDMLHSTSGFSVGSVSGYPTGCWPIVTDRSEDSESLTGVCGVMHLIGTLKIFPAICLEKPDRSIVVPRLALSEKQSLQINRQNHKYYEYFLRNSFKNDSISWNIWDYIDQQTGGFVIQEFEYELLKSAQPDHLLFKIYDQHHCQQSFPKRPRLSFAMKTDSGLLLRGPLNYYYGLAYKNVKCSNLNKNFLLRLNQNRINFFNHCHRVLSTCYNLDISDSVTRRVLLGIMDSIRDYFLFVLNVMLQDSDNSANKLVIYSEQNNRFFRVYQLAKENLAHMYKCLTDKIDLNFIPNFKEFLASRVIPEVKANEKYFNALPGGYDYTKGCRVWREIDSFYENLIAADSSTDKLLFSSNLSEKEIFLYGIRYGSLELPIIVSMLFDIKYKYPNTNCNVGAISLVSNYLENHKNALPDTAKIVYNQDLNLCDENCFHILMDDNLTTGRTLQVASNLLVNAGIYVDGIFVVRYPALNRVEHMFLPSHGAPDPGLFWEFIYGLTSPTPYTRLNYPGSCANNPDSEYVDEIGEFNKTRSYVLGLIFKNWLYSPASEAAELYSLSH